MRFIILVPHRDAIKLLSEYRQRLFTAGLFSAYSFPISSPLAEVSRPFNREELKGLARNIRLLTEGSNGKIVANTCCTVSDSLHLSFCGPSLNLPVTEEAFPGIAKEKILRIMSPIVLCTGMAGKNPAGENSVWENSESSKAPAVSFRAAFVANLSIRPIAGADCSTENSTKNSLENSMEFSYEWKIGEPVWLPSFNRLIFSPR
jgi:hypothetical protein